MESPTGDPRAAGWRVAREQDLNFIRIRSRRRSIFLTLGHVNNPRLASSRLSARPLARSPIPPARRSAAIAINNFVGYRAGPRGPASPAIFMRWMYTVSRIDRYFHGDVSQEYFSSGIFRDRDRGRLIGDLITRKCVVTLKTEVATININGYIYWPTRTIHKLYMNSILCIFRVVYTICMRLCTVRVIFFLSGRYNTYF